MRLEKQRSGVFEVPPWRIVDARFYCETHGAPSSARPYCLGCRVALAWRHERPDAGNHTTEK